MGDFVLKAEDRIRNLAELVMKGAAIYVSPAAGHGNLSLDACGCFIPNDSPRFHASYDKSAITSDLRQFKVRIHNEKPPPSSWQSR